SGELPRPLHEEGVRPPGDRRRRQHAAGDAGLVRLGRHAREDQHGARAGEGPEPQEEPEGRARDPGPGQPLPIHPGPRARRRDDGAGGRRAHRCARQEVSRQGQVSAPSARRGPRAREDPPRESPDAWVAERPPPANMIQVEEIAKALGGVPHGDESDALTARYGDLQHRFEALGGYRLETAAKAILGGLGFREADFARPLAEFSGGWRMRAALARLLLLRPSLLLLDEPTNH